MPTQRPTTKSLLTLKTAIIAAAVAGALLAAPKIADACTRVLWNTNKLAVVVGRTMDWPESTQPILTMLPRGMSRDGARAGPRVGSLTIRRGGPPNMRAWSPRSTASAPPTG